MLIHNPSPPHTQNWSAIALSDSGMVGALLDSGGYIWVYNLEKPPTLQPSRQPTKIGQTYRPTTVPTRSPTRMVGDTDQPTMVPSRRPTEIGGTFEPTPSPTLEPTPHPTKPCLPIHIKIASKTPQKLRTSAAFSLIYKATNTGRSKTARDFAFQLEIPPEVTYLQSVVFPPIKNHYKRGEGGGGKGGPLVTTAFDGSTLITWWPFSLGPRKTKMFKLKLKTVTCPEDLNVTVRASVFVSQARQDPKTCVKEASDVVVSPRSIDR